MRLDTIVAIAVAGSISATYAAELPNLDSVSCEFTEQLRQCGSDSACKDFWVGPQARAACLKLDNDYKARLARIKGWFSDDEMRKCELEVHAGQPDSRISGWANLDLCLGNISARKRKAAIVAAFGTEKPIPSELYCAHQHEKTGEIEEYCLASERRLIDIDARLAFEDPATLDRCTFAARQAYGSWTVLLNCLNGY